MSVCRFCYIEKITESAAAILTMDSQDSNFNSSSVIEEPFGETMVGNLNSTVRLRSSTQQTDQNMTLLVVLKLTILFLLSPVIVCSNFLILVAFYRYKRLRTASNFFIASLASSDLGTGLCLPFTVYIQSSVTRSGMSMICLIANCAAISLCTASVLIMAAIAIDRFTSLAQPLQYNNLMTRASVHKYIAAIWLYAFAIGLVPLIYKKSHIMSEGSIQALNNDDCSFSELLNQPMQLFLFCAVYSPCALILFGCYGYIYVVARYHARAIYTVEISVRQHQDCAHSRYGQTLAITVGLFFFLWIPYQILVVQDVIRGTVILKKWLPFSLGLPIYLSSAANPWIYGYKNTEIRNAVYRSMQDFLKCVGYKTSKYTYPVNVMVASAVNAEHAASTLNVNNPKTRLSMANLTSPMKYTSILMSTLHESEITSTTTSVCRFETTACLTHDFNGLLDLNSHIPGTAC